jgi:hypothetical protein
VKNGILAEISLSPLAMYNPPIQALPQALTNGKLDDTLQLLCAVLFKAANNLSGDSAVRNVIEQFNEVRLCALFDQLLSFDLVVCKAVARGFLMPAIDLCARGLTRTLLRCVDDVNIKILYRPDSNGSLWITPLELAASSGDLEVFRLIYTKSKSLPERRYGVDHELVAFEAAVRASRVQIIRFMFDAGFRLEPSNGRLLAQFCVLLPVLIQSEASEECDTQPANLDTDQIKVYDASTLCNAARIGDLTLA